MNEQQVREIAETAFKRQFGDIEIVRINVRPGFGFEDDSPVVDVNIIYDDESGRVTGRGYNCVRSGSSTRHGGRERTTSAGPASTSSPSRRSVSATRRRSEAFGRTWLRLTQESNEWARWSASVELENTTARDIASEGCATNPRFAAHDGEGVDTGLAERMRCRVHRGVSVGT